VTFLAAEGLVWMEKLVQTENEDGEMDEPIEVTVSAVAFFMMSWPIHIRCNLNFRTICCLRLWGGVSNRFKTPTLSSQGESSREKWGLLYMQAKRPLRTALRLKGGLCYSCNGTYKGGRNQRGQPIPVVDTCTCVRNAGQDPI
jgi:hypothetical protein